MSTTLLDTTGAEVVKALIQARRTAGGVTSGLALTLVAIADPARVAEAEDAGCVAAAAHPCRLIIVVREDVTAAASRLDAEILVGERLGPGEAVVLRMHGRLALHAESVVLPLLAPDVPVVTWWQGEPPTVIAEDPLGVLADRRVTNCVEAADRLAALHQRAVDYRPGDTDIAWTRATPWRALLAGAFDTVTARASNAVIHAEADSPTAALLAGWLASRLGIFPTIEPHPGDGIAEVTIRLTDGNEVAVRRHDDISAVVHHTGMPDRLMPLRHRALGERLAEELRHLDPDQPYAAALTAITGFTGLSTRPTERVHQWRDPQQSSLLSTQGLSSICAGFVAANHGVDELGRDNNGVNEGVLVSRDNMDVGENMTNPHVVVHRNADLLAAASAARLITRLVDVQAVHGSASVVLTGGEIGIATLAAIRASAACGAVNWGQLDIWWGDERFVPEKDPDRNELQAGAALLDAVPVDPHRVHAMPASDSPYGNDVGAAATWYAEELARYAGPDDKIAHFDVLLLGLGPEGHTASIFPESPAAYEEGVAVAVQDSPKPPPTRISMTFPTIQSADEVWMIAAGADKAPAISRALGGTEQTAIPAAGARGRLRTLWLLDQEAAGELTH